MKTMSLRDANQQFSKLVRQVEETGEAILVTRNGEPVVKIMSIVEKRRGRTAEQDAALARLTDPANHFRSPEGWHFDRNELWDEQVRRHSVVRSLPDRPGQKKPRYSRNRG
jgi:prevent-host-death family protein